MENEENVEQQESSWAISDTQDEVLSNNEGFDNSTNEPQPEVNNSIEEDSNAEIAEDSENDISDEELLAHMLSEQYGQEFSNLSDFEDYNSTKFTSNQEQANPFASETLKQINDYVKSTGRSVEDFMVTQSLNPDEMSDEEAVMFMLQRENPTLSKDDVKFYMEETYKLNAEDGTNEKRFGAISLQKEAIRAKNDINEFKSHYQTPVTDKAIESQSSAEDLEARTSFFGDVVQDMQEIEGLTFDIDDKGTEFTFAINDENRPDPEEYVGQLENFFDQYVDAEGNWNYDQLNTDMFILNNIDSIIKSVANHYKSQGTEEVVQELKNPSYGGKESQSADNGAPTMAQQIFNAMRQQGDL